MLMLSLRSYSSGTVLLVFAAMAGAVALPARAGEIPVGRLVTQVDPTRYDVTGGSRIRIYGDGSGGGFQPGFRVELNGAEVTDLKVLSPTAMTGLVPANPLGTYDLELRSASGVLLFVLPQAVDYYLREIPPPEDVSVTRQAMTRVELSWSNPTFNDQIIIRRNGIIRATLAGDATEYTDEFTSPPTSPLEYSLQAVAGDRVSAVSTAQYLPYRQECLPILGTGGSGRASGLWFPVVSGGPELQMCFHLGEDAPALIFQVFMTKVRLPGQLKCRIRSIDPPHDVLGPLYDGIVVEDFALFREDYTEALLPEPLAAGDYIIGFYSDGVDPNQWSYELQIDGDPEYPGEPCPPPFYPMLKVTPLCDNLPPTVLDIIAERPHLDNNFDLDRLPFGAAPVADLDLTLRADAVDFDGAVVRYGWTVSFACNLLVGEEEDECLRRCAEEGNCLDAFNSDANSGLYHFPFFGNWNVGVTVTDNAGATAFASETIYVDVFDEPPVCGEAPKIYQRLDPDVEDPFFAVRYIPDINDSLGEVNQEYTVKVTPSNCSGIQSVDMLMIDPNNGVTYPSLEPAAVIPESMDPATGGARYGASFNMSDLGYNDRFVLRVTATDDDNWETVREWTIPMCVLPLLFDSDHNDVDFVGTSIDYDSGANRYDVGARFPGEPILDLPIDLDDLGIHLDNVVDAYLKFDEYLDDEFWHPQSVKGKLRATLLSYDLFEKDWETSLDGPVAYGCDDYEIQYHANNIDIYSDDWSWEVFDTTLWEGFIGPVHVRVRGSLDVGLGIDVQAREVRLIVRTVEEEGDPVVEIGVQIVPAVEAWAEGEIRVEVFFGLASASVLLRPTVGIEFPIDLQAALPPIALNVTVDECFNLKLEVKVRACVDLPFFGEECASSDWLEIFDEGFGDACAAAPALASSAGLLQDEPSILKYPSIAVSPDGATAMVVFVDDTDPDPMIYKPDVYYMLDSGLGFAAPELIYPPGEAYSQRDTRVAFLGNARALAVWTQGRLTYDEVAALPQTTAGANAGFNHQDIFFALWDPDGEWGPARMLTNDAAPIPLTPEGKPVVAAIPGADAAWVVWVRSDHADFFDAEGDPDLGALSIFARRISGNGAVGPMVKITTDDGPSPAADIQPAVAVSPSGAVALAVWVRDADGDFDTAQDRRLMYSVNLGGAWSGPLPVTDPAELPGVLMPTVALNSDDDGMLAFTVRERDPLGNVAGEGNKDLVYTIEIRNTIFQGPMPLKQSPAKRGRRVFDGVYGRDPIVQYLDPLHAAVVFRSFDGFGRSGGDGEVGISVLDLSQPEPRWTLAHDLTDDTYRDWDIAAGVGPSCIRTVRDSTNPAGLPGNHALVFKDIAPAPDISVDRIRLSNPHAPAGSVVTATVVVRNAGLAAPMSTTPAVLRLGEVTTAGFAEWAAIPFMFTADPDDIQLFSDSFFMPETLTRLRAMVDPIPTETDTTNNATDALLGVLPPAELTCTQDGSVRFVRAWRPRVGLFWSNAEPYDTILIYRDGRLLTELDGHLESYLDTSPSPGLHTWSVRGRIGLALSSGVDAQRTLRVALPGDSDVDEDVDRYDFATMVDPCLGGPDMPYTEGCDLFDFDADGDVDLLDIGTFTLAFTGDRSPNLLRNPGFEDVPGPFTGQGLLPSNWVIESWSPDTYSNDGSFGLPPEAYGNFPGVTAHEGLRWVAGAWAGSIIESFGQQLSEPLVPNAEYRLTAWLHQALRPDIAHPGAYEVYLATEANEASGVSVGRLADTIGLEWQEKVLTFTTPADADERPWIIFVPIPANPNQWTYPGMDSVSLTQLPQ